MTRHILRDLQKPIWGIGEACSCISLLYQSTASQPMRFQMRIIDSFCLSTNRLTKTGTFLASSLGVMECEGVGVRDRVHFDIPPIDTYKLPNDTYTVYSVSYLVSKCFHHPPHRGYGDNCRSKSYHLSRGKKQSNTYTNQKLDVVSGMKRNMLERISSELIKGLNESAYHH